MNEAAAVAFLPPCMKPVPCAQTAVPSLLRGPVSLSPSTDVELLHRCSDFLMSLSPALDCKLLGGGNLSYSPLHPLPATPSPEPDT